MHDVIRQYQTKLLYDNYRMTGLYIYRDRISKSLRDDLSGRCGHAA